MLVCICFSWALALALVALLARHLESIELAEGAAALAALTLLLGLLIYVIRAATEMIGNRASHLKSFDTAGPQAQRGSRDADPTAADRPTG